MVYNGIQTIQTERYSIEKHEWLRCMMITGTPDGSEDTWSSSDSLKSSSRLSCSWSEPLVWKPIFENLIILTITPQKSLKIYQTSLDGWRLALVVLKPAVKRKYKVEKHCRKKQDKTFLLRFSNNLLEAKC